MGEIQDCAKVEYVSALTEIGGRERSTQEVGVSSASDCPDEVLRSLARLLGCLAAREVFTGHHAKLTKRCPAPATVEFVDDRGDDREWLSCKPRLRLSSATIRGDGRGADTALLPDAPSFGRTA
jgi:hypothetical protein